MITKKDIAFGWTFDRDTMLHRLSARVPIYAELFTSINGPPYGELQSQLADTIRRKLYGELDTHIQAKVEFYSERQAAIADPDGAGSVEYRHADEVLTELRMIQQVMRGVRAGE